MKKGSRWRFGDMYLFVIDLKGYCFMHEDTSLAGKNISDLKDPNGKPIILIRQMGTKAFTVLKDKASEFVYKDTYIFVVDSTFTVLADPPFPGEEGHNVFDYSDVNGKYFFREFFRVANEKGSGWIDYSWPKPGEAKPSPKSSYVRKIVIRGVFYLVGTGIYLG